MLVRDGTLPAHSARPGLLCLTESGEIMINSINSIVRRAPAWPVYIVMVLHFGWLFYLGATGQTGPEPIQVLEHSLGDIALQVFVVVLAITPLRRYTGINLIKFRRALGLAVFFYVSMHLLVWLVLDVGILAQIWADLIKRPYITIGMTAFVLMIPLAVTSNNRSIRKLGPLRWNRLHKLTYAAILLGAVHNVMIQKVWETEPLVYLAIIVALLLLRVRLPRRAATA